MSRLSYDGITVDFGATRALNNVTFSVAPGEIVGLLGHNGAGKSTLFNVTAGVLSNFTGTYTIDGDVVSKSLTPKEAGQLGITVIHQEPALATNLTVFENLFLARPSAGKKTSEQKSRAKEALASVGASHISLDTPLEILSLGERQLVDLARGMLSGDMKILLLDEPTAALGKAETEALHQLIKNFAAKGITVLYVSHRLPDILEICTRIVVMRGGETVVDGPTSDFTPEALAKALVPELREQRQIETTPGDEILRVPVGSDHISIKSGEVVGIFGMAGGPQFDLAAKLGGAEGRAEVEFDGRPLRISKPSQAIKEGIFYSPSDRDIEGLIASETAQNNVLLPWFRSLPGKGWWVSDNTGKKIYDEARKSLEIHGPDGDAEISQFSGGNRQKHLLARWMYPAVPKLLILAQPTQGVDVGARIDIVDGVRTAASKGAGVLVVSSESDEIAMMCDRSYVIFNDEISEVKAGPDYNEALLASLLSMASKQRQN